MEKEIEKAIRETLVISNPSSVKIAVDKIMKILIESAIDNNNEVNSSQDE